MPRRPPSCVPFDQVAPEPKVLGVRGLTVDPCYKFTTRKTTVCIWVRLRASECVSEEGAARKVCNTARMGFHFLTTLGRLKPMAILWESQPGFKSTVGSGTQKMESWCFFEAAADPEGHGCSRKAAPNSDCKSG